MRRNLIIVAIALFFVGAGTFAFFELKPDPPIETKFVQPPVRRTSGSGGVQEVMGEATDVSNQEPKVTSVYKTPGNYALLDNPKHVYQTFNNCGAATLSMVLSGLGEKVSQKELGDKMRPFQNPDGDNDDKTIFTYEFVDWAKRYGFESVGRVNGDIELLKTLTANGILVVVKTWLKVGEDIGHFRIVRGFDEAKQVIFQDDSYDGPNKRISYYDFLSMWQPFNYAYIIVYPPNQAGLVEAIIGEEMQEGVDWQKALIRAKKEAELAPENIYPLFNISTSYYHLGDYQNSISSFERVESRLPRRMLWYQIEPIQAYFELGDYDRVFAISGNILENGNRAYSELYHIRGEIYLAQGNKEKAREQFELAIEYNQNFEPAKQALESI
ncbi:C39 family peptidase [Patescibacteria group bacterium]|nr:C39 family peptidase [Patescibacteria group bacterium]